MGPEPMQLLADLVLGIVYLPSGPSDPLVSIAVPQYSTEQLLAAQPLDAECQYTVAILFYSNVTFPQSSR